MQKGFSKGPDFSGLLVMLAIAGAIGYAIYAYEGPLWQKLLIAPGMLLTLAAGGLVAALAIGGLAWIFMFVVKQRGRARLNTLLLLERDPDPAGAAARAHSLCESFGMTESDLFRNDPALCRRFADAARRDGPLRPCYLRALMDNAPWSGEAESALFDGREAVAPRDRWRWLYWFRKKLPEDDPAVSDRLADALEHALAGGNDYDRRGNWADCLARVRDSERWRRLAQRYRGDLDALAAERGERLSPRERQGLAWLLGKAGSRE
jgi:hypothetical protein